MPKPKPKNHEPLPTVKSRNDALIHALRSLSVEDPEYWAFKSHSVKSNETAYFQYPATMVPRMQGVLIDVALQSDPRIATVLDPFVGSGTTLVEALKHDLCFTGFDINPLAILLCRVKGAPFVADIQQKYETLVSFAKADTSDKIETRLIAKDKWFTPTAQQLLSRLRRAIRQEQDVNARCFFWICLAEAARLASNTRTTTFKLHIRTTDDIATREGDINETVPSVFRRVVDLYLTRGGNDSPYSTGVSDVYLHDVRDPLPQKCVQRKADLLISSPPYGDNKTTVTYGQHSFLPLHWIDLSDIDPRLDDKWLRSTHELDARSLGGVLVNWKQRVERILDLSPTCKTLYEQLLPLGGEGCARLVVFFDDIDKSFEKIVPALSPDALLFWTVGNRSIRGKGVPTDQIMSELLEQRGVNMVDQFGRKIHTKRMAHRNRESATMTTETLLIMRNRSST